MSELDNILSQLRSTEPYLDDNGFTAVVMEQLPARRALPLWMKNVILLAAAALGSGITALQLPVGQIAALLGEVTINVPLVVGAAAVVVYSLSCGAVWVAQRDLL